MLPEGYPSRLWTLHGPASSNILPSQSFFQDAHPASYPILPNTASLSLSVQSTRMLCALKVCILKSSSCRRRLKIRMNPTFANSPIEKAVLDTDSFLANIK